jgi:hypothetical protein
MSSAVTFARIAYDAGRNERDVANATPDVQDLHAPGDASGLKEVLSQRVQDRALKK